MNEKPIKIIFWIMLAAFIIIILSIFTLNEISRNLPFRYVMPAAGVVLVGLGITLVVLTVKRKVTGKLKAFLILTGAAAIGIPVFAVLHNLVYALFMLLFGDDFWGNMGDEPVFFILAIIVCPLAYLVGVVGTIVLDIINKRAAAAGTA